MLATYLVCALVCALEPNAGDCWFGVDWAASTKPTLAALFERMRWNYQSYNPRLGETFLYLTVTWRALHVLLTPAAIVAMLLGLQTLATGRLPRAREPHDALAFLVTLALACGVHSIGQMAFYRPYSTNYVYGFAVQAWTLVPLRIGARTRAWMAPAMLLAGAAAGMCNEHTGPLTIVAFAALGVARVRRERAAWPWVAAGLLGLCAGFAGLFFAPGQTQRYAGSGRVPIADRVVAHGFGGAAQLVGGIVWEAAPSVAVLVIAALAARRRVAWRVPLVFVGAALFVAATLLAAPFWSARMYLAPALLVAGAALLVLLEACPPRILVAGAGAVAAVHALAFVIIFAHLSADYDARAAVLAHAAKGTIVYVAPTRHAVKSHWALGDELINSNWRPWVAQHYGLRNLALDTPDAALLARSGVPVDWERDGKPLAKLPRGVEPPPPAKPYDAAYEERARAYAAAVLPKLGARGHTLCLRAYLPPADAPPRCLATYP